MSYQNIFVFNRERFAIGQETESGKYYLSFPVSNGMVEYEEYYELSKTEFDRLSERLKDTVALAERCKARQEDDRLLEKPGSKRGRPV